MKWLKHRHHPAHDHQDRGHRHPEGRRFARDEGSPRTGRRHGSGHHHEDGDHAGRRGGKRLFDHGALRLVLLHLISEKPSHGYELIKEIEERLAGAYSPSPGVIYPTLTLLEEINQIAATEQDGPRKQFTITDEGRAHLKANAAAVDLALMRMHEARTRQAAIDAPPLVRAMENLKLALRLRLKSGTETPETINRMTAILDQAAREIDQA